MEIKKLGSVLKSPIVFQLINGLVYSLLLYAVVLWGGFFPYLAFLVMAFYIYFRYVRDEAFSSAFTFWAFVIISLIATQSLPSLFTIFLSLVGGVLVGILCVAQSFQSSQPKILLGIFYHSIIFSGTALFASLSPENIKWWHWIVLFILYLGVARDYFKTEMIGIDKRKNFYAFVFSFILLQVFWFSWMLPMGFLNVGCVVLVCSILLADLFIKSFLGIINKRILLRELGIFVAFVLLIFIVGLW